MFSRRDHTPMFLRDIRESASLILERCAGKGFEAFLADPVLLDSVLWHVRRMGDAAFFVNRDLVSRHPEFPWAGLEAFRTVLVGRYFGYDPEVLYETIRTDLPLILQGVEAVIRAEGI